MGVDSSIYWKSIHTLSHTSKKQKRNNKHAELQMMPKYSTFTTLAALIRVENDAYAKHGVPVPRRVYPIHTAISQFKTTLQNIKHTSNTGSPCLYVPTEMVSNGRAIVITALHLNTKPTVFVLLTRQFYNDKGLQQKLTVLQFHQGVTEAVVYKVMKTLQVLPKSLGIFRLANSQMVIKLNVGPMTFYLK